MTDLLCLDANIYIKRLVAEGPVDLDQAAEDLIDRAAIGSILVAPAFAWAEVGSTLRKKVRTREISAQRASEHWETFCGFPVAYVDMGTIRARAWEIAEEFGLATLYDAAYLACAELAPIEEPGAREFWTADGTLLQQLGDRCPAYVHRLGA